MKAIIIAGGKGTRMGKYTENTPKCMLKLSGKTLLERQIEVLNKCGINEIVLLKGHLAEKIMSEGITRSYIDPPWVKNMVNALFSVDNELKNVEEGVLISYGDLIFDEDVLNNILKCKKEICVAVDDNWKEYWKARFDGKLDDLESLQIGKEGNIIELGTPDCLPEKCHSRYVGLIKLSKKGIGTLRRVYYENKKKYWDKNDRWLNSKSFQQACMTDLLQAVIISGEKIWPVHISGGWLEFDTEKDYELASKWMDEGKLKNFIRLEDER